MDLFDKFLRLIQSMEDEGVEYILIGGYAIILHGFLRATQDVDFFVNPSEENLNKLRKALKSVYKDDAIDEITSKELMQYAVIRYGTEDGFSIDLIARIGEAFQFSDLQYEKKVINGISLKIATAQTLYKLKKNTYREIDQMDIQFLLRKMEKNAD
jgi:hypothetical protein